METNYIEINNNVTISRGEHIVLHKPKGSAIPISAIEHIEGFDSKLNKERYIKVVKTGTREIFSERSFQSKELSIFQTRVYYSHYNWGISQNTYSDDWYRYSIGDNQIKKANYLNLKRDLKKSQESMQFLKRGNEYRILELGLMAAGTLMLTGGIVKSIQNSSENSENSIPSEGTSFEAPHWTVFTGAICFPIAHFYARKRKKDYFIKALKSY
ncbi:hypothetical protein GCM10023331_27160 [Algivirga pacifica]|uniref:Uncharacterized protein n=2 Tax=Algivirga pacifica TaxID=1162670 RepID=A0ABP9DH59_9BACT